jgi:hypothetical protein
LVGKYGYYVGYRARMKSVTENVIHKTSNLPRFYSNSFPNDVSYSITMVYIIRPTGCMAHFYKHMHSYKVTLYAIYTHQNSPQGLH